MLGQIIGTIMGITFVILVFMWDRLIGIRSKIRVLFWEDIIYSDRNQKKMGIKMFKMLLRINQVMYLYFGVAGALYSLINQDIGRLIALAVFLFAWPLMYRLIMGFQRKLWDIN